MVARFLLSGITYLGRGRCDPGIEPVAIPVGFVRTVCGSGRPLRHLLIVEPLQCSHASTSNQKVEKETSRARRLPQAVLTRPSYLHRQ